MAGSKSLIFVVILLLFTIQIQSSPIIYLNSSSTLIDNLSNEAYDATERLTKTSINSNMLMYYSYFTSMGYCEEPRVEQGKCCSYIFKNNWEMVDHGVDPDNSINNYVFIKSDAYKKFIFTFPGTRGAIELTQEILKGYLVDIEGGDGLKVSSYFKERCDGLTNLVFSESNMNIIRSHEGYEVLFVGHSLGGALASILSLKSVLFNHINSVQNPLVLFTINTPRAGNDIFANEVMKRIPNVFRLVRKGDLVSHVPPCIINLKGKCQTVLDQDKFSIDLNSSDQMSYYYWHIGGLILMNRKMTEAVICPSNQGENFEDDCNNILTINITLHNYIFNNQYGIYERCTKNRRRGI